MELYSTGQAAEIINVNMRRLIGFISRGVVTPEVHPQGTGRRTQLNALNMVQIRIIADLSDNGVDVRLAGKVAEKASCYILSDDPYKYLVPDSCFSIVIDVKKLRERYFKTISFEGLEGQMMQGVFSE